jgi:pyruvate kinase
MAAKLTKIVATIGPACESDEKIKELILAGVNIFRFNFKHNEIAWHEALINRVTELAKSMDTPIGVLLDLQGPEIRVIMKTDQMVIVPEKEIELGSQEFTISHPAILEHLPDGQFVVINDGQFTFTLKKRKGKYFLLPQQGGTLQPNKSMNFPGADYPIDVLTSRDLGGIEMAGRAGVDYIALSFVRSAQDVDYLADEMKKRNVVAKIVSKIEAKRAIDNLDSIIDTSDAIMVARGDLGVELPIEQVPYYQKQMIRKCFEKGKPVITATQMLESMMTSPYPTRAEISDIANAAYDLTDAVMLSGESAMGKFPLEAVRTMAKVVSYNEGITIEDVRVNNQYQLERQEQILCDAAYNLYHKGRGNVDFKGFLVFTQTGKTAQMLSRYRPQVPIYAFAPSYDIADSLTIHFGVYPFVLPSKHAFNDVVTKESTAEIVSYLHDKGLCTKGDKLIMMHGAYWGVPGGASTIRIITV